MGGMTISNFSPFCPLPGPGGPAADQYRRLRSLFARLLRLLLLDELAAPFDEEEDWESISMLEYGPERLRLTHVFKREGLAIEEFATARKGVVALNDVVLKDRADHVIEEEEDQERTSAVIATVPTTEDVLFPFLLHSCPLSVRFLSPKLFLLVGTGTGRG